MKRRVLSILLTLCMVLMLCPVTAFADDYYTVTQNFKYGTLAFIPEAENPHTFTAQENEFFMLTKVENCAPYEFVGWKESVSGTVYEPWISLPAANLTFDAVYQVQGDLAVTVDGFEVGKTPADCTYSFESTIPGVSFSADDIQYIYWEKYVFNEAVKQYQWLRMDETEVFQAGTQYKLLLCLDNKGLELAPAVTMNGKTPENCTIATRDGVPIQLQIYCELGTPAEPPAPSLVRGDIDFDGVVTVKDAIMLQDCLENPESLEKLTSEQYEAADFNGDGVVTESDLTALRSFLNPITIDGPDVVCSWQEYEFTVTPADGVTLDKEFGYDTGMKGGGADLTVDADGVGHGVVPTNWYDLQTNCFTLTAHGNTADGTPVTGTKTVQVSPEHIYVDGVCGCGAVQQYTVTYDGGESSDPVTDVKTHGVDLTLRGETFTMDGFVQTGWVDKETGAIYDLGATYDEDRDATLYPYWEKLITVTAPFTTTVALGDAGEPGETTFMLGLIDGLGNELTFDDQYFFAEITTDGAGSYSGVMTITATEKWLYDMLYEGAFIWQYDGEEDGWTYDDTVWGVRLYMPEVAARSADEASYKLLLYPTYVMDDGCFNLDLNAGPVEEMTFTNIYTKTVTEPTEPTKNSPQTGDNSHMALWIALLLVSGAGVIGTTVYGKKKRAK